MSRVPRRVAVVAAASAAVGVAIGARVGGRAMVGRAEGRLCTTAPPRAHPPSDRARSLHAELWVADLHADSRPLRSAAR